MRDTAHQLRTPLAVLKVQVQSALRGDLAPQQALQDISTTVDGATELANQMLALAKVEQLRQQDDAPVLDWAPIVRAVALDLSALIAEHGLDFSIDTDAAPVRAHAWALQELTRNLLHNAVRHCPRSGTLGVSLRRDGLGLRLTVADSGPGLDGALRKRLFQPFSAGPASPGRPAGSSGLGLAICHDIVASLGGRIRLDNRNEDGQPRGLDAIVWLPLAQNLAT